MFAFFAFLYFPNHSTQERCLDSLGCRGCECACGPVSVRVRVSQLKSVNNDAWHMYVLHVDRLLGSGVRHIWACGICFVNLLNMLNVLAKGGIRAALRSREKNLSCLLCWLNWCLYYELQNRIPEKISDEWRWSESECSDKYIHMFSMFARLISMESTTDITGCLSINTTIVFKL